MNGQSPPPPDVFPLERFVFAQDSARTYEHALAELSEGRKQGHWMWFVFPQLRGLGRSAMSEAYAIHSLEEARAYLADPLLGARLIECLRVLTELTGRSAEQVFGAVDAMKLRSSLTLFARATPQNPLFGETLAKYFGGQGDPLTEDLLSRENEDAP